MPEQQSETKFWLGVVSRNHCRTGMVDSFAQVCHGKERPLKRMKKGDWFVFYSPKLIFGDKEPCQQFTGIGQVISGDVYQADMGGGFMPFRIDIDFCEAEEAPIRPLIEKLSFIRDKQRWGYQFRFGHLEVPRVDFLLIAEAMGVADSLKQAS